VQPPTRPIKTIKERNNNNQMSRGHFFLRLDDVICLFLFYIFELLCCSAGVFPRTRLIEFF
jgi:hypothetical protein